MEKRSEDIKKSSDCGAFWFGDLYFVFNLFIVENDLSESALLMGTMALAKMMWRRSCVISERYFRITQTHNIKESSSFWSHQKLLSDNTFLTRLLNSACNFGVYLTLVNLASFSMLWGSKVSFSGAFFGHLWWFKLSKIPESIFPGWVSLVICCGK